MFYRLIIFMVAVGSCAVTAYAQSPAASAGIVGQTPASSISPTAKDNAVLESNESELRVSFIADTRAPIGWLRFRRFLSLDPVKDSELTLAIANRLLTDALKQHEDQPEQAVRKFDSFTRETELLQSAVKSIPVSSQNISSANFLNTYFTDKTAQITLLESISPSAAAHLSQKILEARAKTYHDLTEILEKPDLSEAERSRKIDRIMQRYTANEAKIDRKIAKKLAIKNSLDEETEDEGLEDELAAKEDDVLEEASRSLDEKDELSDFIDELKRKEGDRSLVILQKLLATAPESSKSGIETAIDAVIASKSDSFRRDPAAVEQMINEHSGSDKIRTLLLERIKEQSKDEDFKQQIELIKAKPSERAKKTKELQRETEKKAAEKLKEDAKKKVESSEESRSTDATSSEAPEIKASPSPEIKNESVTVEIKIKENGTLEKTSYKVKKGSSVTVKAESAYLEPITIQFDDGLGSLSVKKEEKKSLSPFVISGSVSFTVNGVAGTIVPE